MSARKIIPLPSIEEALKNHEEASRIEAMQKTESGKVSLPTMILFIQQSDDRLNLHFNFTHKTVVDKATGKVVGEFNRLPRTGRVYVSPLALVTIRTRLEENTMFSASDKMVRDALTACYDEMHTRYFDLVGLPEWLRGAP
jgi:hypothetical protein